MTRATRHKSETADDQNDLGGTALRAFFRISEKWGLTLDQARKLLGSPAEEIFTEWEREREGPVPGDVLERISYALGIYKALHILFTDAQQADAWVRRANTAPLFRGGAALDRMLSGEMEGLRLVRQYLDAQEVADVDPGANEPNN